MCPKLTAWIRQLHQIKIQHSFSSISWCCLRILSKTEFFHKKCVQKGTPTTFPVDITLYSRTLEDLSCFSFVVANAVTALVPKKTHKNAQNDVFETFALRNELFSLETVAKAHTKLQECITSMNKRFPVQK